MVLQRDLAIILSLNSASFILIVTIYVIYVILL